MINKKTLFILFTSVFYIQGKSQSSNDILNLLIENKTLTQEKADSLRAEAAIKQQETDAKKKSFPINAGKALQLSGYTQIRYQQLDEKGKVSGFDIRRARLDTKGDISPYFGYRLQFDLAVTPKLLDAYVDYKLFDFLNFRLGQFVIPFSLENTTSDTKLYSIDRSLITENLSSRKGDVIGDNNGRDIGLQAGGSFLKINDLSLVEYSLGIFNGNGIGKSADNYRFKDLSGRLIFHVIKGIDLGFSAYNGKYIRDTKTSTTPDTTKKISIKDGIKTTTIKQDSLTTKITEYGPQDRIRYAADINLEFYGASLKAEYYKGTNDISESTKTKIDGYYLQLGYFIIPSELQGIVKYENFKNDTPDTDISKIIIGLNYNISSNSRIQIAYNIVKDKNNKKDLNQAVAQFQIGF